MKNLSGNELRDVIILAHCMATGNYIQSDSIMRGRIGKVLEKAVCSDAIMSGLLGRPGGDTSKNILGRNNETII